MRLRVLAIATLAATAALALPQDLKGAKSALERVLEAPKTANVQQEAFDKGLAAYIADLPGLQRQEAAKRWVALLSSAFAISKERPNAYSTDSSVQRAMMALPGPESWTAVREELKALPAGATTPKQRQALDLLMALLVNDKPAQARIVTAMTKDMDPADESTVYAASDALMVYREWAAYSRDKAHIKRSLLLSYLSGSNYDSYISPLVLLLDPPDREEVAKAYFEHSEYVYPPDESNPPLRQFFLEMAVKYGKQNEEAVWQSLATLGARQQFEAFSKATGRFASLVGPSHAFDDAARKVVKESNNALQAVAFYVVNLALDGQTATAEQILVNASADLSDAFEYGVDLDTVRSTEGLEAVATMFSNALLKKPNAGYWSFFATVAPRAARGDLLVSTAEKALATGGLSQGRKNEVNDALARGYLAVDRTDEAIALLLASVNDRGPASDANFQAAYASATILFELSHLLKREDLFQQAMKIADSMSGQYAAYFDSYVTAYLLQRGMFAEAEERIVRAIVQAMKSEEVQMGYPSENAGRLLASLLDVYARAGRYDDVLYLLKNAPMWPWPDLEEAAADSPDVLIAAATALAKTGRRDEALRLTERLLQTQPGNDRAYELYVSLAPADKVLAGLDAVFASDQFEERPLIWKAKVLFDRGQYEEAEKVARQAIAIDPSDGEQGKGDRMRVYAVLSDVLRKRGEAQQADVYANAVRAIRISEDADDFYAAGLTMRAIAMYEQALTIFEDAYCIQSRLAVQMLESGDADGAAAHFRKAFELMPDSFGRIESHCFGCEGVFDSPEAQDIAMTVLQQLLKDRPDKPQVPYLMGYLYASRGAYAQAATFFEQAVKLDPNYLNAWIHLAEAYKASGGPSDAAQRAAVAIAQLDPLGRHSSSASYGSAVTDFAQLWRLGNDSYRRQPVAGGALFELPATRQKLESAPRQAEGIFSPAGNATGPASVLFANDLLSQVLSMVSGAYGDGAFIGAAPAKAQAD